MHANAFIHHLTRLSDYENQIVHTQYIPSSDASSGKIDKPLHPLLQARLESLGISSLYVHQAMAVENTRCGKNIMVSTASASGKTLCYNLPVLETVLNDRASRALYLFPTKALAQDQLRSLNQLACPELISSGDCATFDGDTPQPERGEIKKEPDWFLPTPICFTLPFCRTISPGRHYLAS